MSQEIVRRGNGSINIWKAKRGCSVVRLELGIRLLPRFEPGLPCRAFQEFRNLCGVAAWVSWGPPSGIANLHRDQSYSLSCPRRQQPAISLQIVMFRNCEELQRKNGVAGESAAHLLVARSQKNIKKNKGSITILDNSSVLRGLHPYIESGPWLAPVVTRSRDNNSPTDPDRCLVGC